MAKLNKIQKYAILWLHSQGIDQTSISDDIGVTKQQVANVLLSSTDKNTNPVETASKPVGNRPNSKDLMITDTASKTRKVAIMTKEASEINDTFKKQNSASRSSRNEKNIFRPLDNK